MEFPLKPDFFPTVTLSAQERREYVELAERSVQQVRRLLVDSSWKRVSEKHGVIVRRASYIDNHAHASSCAQACLVYSATVYASGTISEVLDALASPATEEYRKTMKFLYEDAFVDGVCLHSFTPPRNTVRNGASKLPTTIKWAAFDENSLRTRKEHESRLVGTDYCFLEHAGVIKDDAATSCAYCIQESIVRDAEVPVMAGLGMKRDQFHNTGILIVPTQHNNVLQVSSVLQINTALAASSILLEKLMTRHVTAIRKLAAFLDRRRLSRMSFISRDEWVPDEDRRSCAVCSKMFALRRKHHCRNCGEVVCSVCAPPREVDVTSFGVANLRICTVCVVRARAANADALEESGGDVYEFQSISSEDTNAYVDEELHDNPELTSKSNMNASLNPHLQDALADNIVNGGGGRESLPSPRLSVDSDFSVSLDSPDANHPLATPHSGGFSSTSSISTSMAMAMRQSNLSSRSSAISVSDLSTPLQDQELRITSVSNMHPPPPPPSSNGTILYENPPETLSQARNPAQPQTRNLRSQPSSARATATPREQCRGCSSCTYGGSLISYDSRNSNNHCRSSTSSSTSLLDVLAALHDMKVDLAATTAVVTSVNGTSAPQHYKHKLPPHPYLQRASEQQPSGSWPLRGRSTATTLSLSSKPSELRDSSSTVDIDMIESGCITLISPELTQRLRGQDSAERRTTRISSLSAYTTLSDDEPTNSSPPPPPAPASAPPARVSELTSLRSQVEDLRRTLESTTQQLNDYRDRARVQQHMGILERDVNELEVDEQQARSRGPRAGTSSAPTSTSTDPIVVERKRLYHELLSELHEIMGLPAVQTRASVEAFQKELYAPFATAS